MCRSDPNASAYVSERQANISRRDPAKKPKPKKKKVTAEKSKKAASNEAQASSSSVVAGAKRSPAMADAPPAKRRCLSADQKLALTTPDFVGIEGRLTRRSSRCT